MKKMMMMMVGITTRKNDNDDFDDDDEFVMMMMVGWTLEIGHLYFRRTLRRCFREKHTRHTSPGSVRFCVGGTVEDPSAAAETAAERAETRTIVLRNKLEAGRKHCETSRNSFCS